MIQPYPSDARNRTPSVREGAHGELLLQAFNALEVRQVLGRYVVRTRWPFYKWYIADHPYLVGLISVISILAISLLQLTLGIFFAQHAINVAVVGDFAIGVIIIFVSYLIALKQTKWKRELIEEMDSLGTITEFDERYNLTDSPSHITWPLLFLMALVMLFLKEAFIPLDFNTYPPVIILVSALIPVPAFFMGIYRSIGDCPCWDEIDTVDGELREATQLEQQIANSLESLILLEITALGLQKLLEKDTGCTADNPVVIFRKTRFPQCRWFHYYGQESRITFEIHDMGLEEATRLIVAKLRRLATPMFNEVSLKRRMLIVFNLLFVIMYPLSVLLIGWPIPQAIPVLLFLGGVILAITTLSSIKMHHESQEVLRQLLDESDKLTDFEQAYYYNNMFGDMVRMDLTLLIAYVFIAVTIQLFASWIL